MVESKAMKNKAPLKADLVIKLKELQLNFNALEAENNKNLEKIKFLEERIETMEKKTQTMPNETQTECGLELKCSECNFEARTDSELNWHMGKTHGWSDEQSSDDLNSSSEPRDCKRCDYQAEDKYDFDGHTWTEHEDDDDGHIKCQICDENFANVGNLMKHKKIKHREKVASCQNYNSGGCPFDDSKCWFIHIKYNEDFKCIICDETFHSKSYFMQHRKNQHSEMVQPCKNIECVFKTSCWFKHDHQDTQVYHEKKNENDKYIQKLLAIVEKLNEKVAKLENSKETRQNTV